MLGTFCLHIYFHLSQALGQPGFMYVQSAQASQGRQFLLLWNVLLKEDDHAKVRHQKDL